MPQSTPPPEAFACAVVVRAASQFTADLNAVLKPHGISEPGFNVLRILRGGPESGLTCGQIGARLVSRGSDVTRLVDRLETASLVGRRRHDDDRRVVLVALHTAGLSVLDALDEPVSALQRRFWNGVPEGARAHVVRTLTEIAGSP